MDQYKKLDSLQLLWKVSLISMGKLKVFSANEDKKYTAVFSAKF